MYVQRPWYDLVLRELGEIRAIVKSRALYYAQLNSLVRPRSLRSKRENVFNWVILRVLLRMDTCGDQRLATKLQYRGEQKEDSVSAKGY
jgi:hypothetical protein